MKMHMYVAEVSDKIVNDIPKRIIGPATATLDPRPATRDY